MSELRSGDAVTWRHVTRGGYGYSWHVPAYVVTVRPTRIGIAALAGDGKTWLPRWVTRERLEPGHPNSYRHRWGS